MAYGAQFRDCGTAGVRSSRDKEEHAPEPATWGLCGQRRG